MGLERSAPWRRVQPGIWRCIRACSGMHGNIPGKSNKGGRCHELEGIPQGRVRSGRCRGPAAASGKATDTANPVVATTPSSETASPSKSKRIYNTAPAGASTDAVFPSAMSPKQVRRQGADVHLSRSILCQQGHQNAGLKWIQRGAAAITACATSTLGARAPSARPSSILEGMRMRPRLSALRRGEALVVRIALRYLSRSHLELARTWARAN
jgi:hypothetical protein